MRFFITLIIFAVFCAPTYAHADEAQPVGSGVDRAPEVTADSSEGQVVPDESDVSRESDRPAPVDVFSPPTLSEQISAGEILTGRTGYIHPFLSVGGYHTDNLFRTPENEESDWVAVITPGLWVSLPASQQKLLEINLLNTAPGGLAVDRFRNESERRFQGYALYRADIREHDKFPDENRVDHRAEGLFRVSLRGGLSLELVDVYDVNHDPYGTGGTPERQLDKYASNLINTNLSYQLSPKIMLRADYSNYNLNYDKERNDYRDRTDNTYSGYVFYQATPKTALFIQYEYTDIDYDENISSDNDQTNYFVGIEMKATAKIRARIKAGYAQKDYDDIDDERDEFVAEGQIDYALTRKTSIYLQGLRRILESDDRNATDILSTRFQLGYRQKILAKMRAEISGFYVNNDYDGTVTIGTQTGNRDDDEYGGVVALGYSPATWSTFTLGYEYRKRDSNFDSEDYRSNTVFLRMTVSL